MRTIFIAIFILPFITKAQVTDSNRAKTFLYNQFKDGFVLMKSGVVEDAPLNYNTENQSIYFIKNEKQMMLTGLEEIDTIYLQNKKFVPVKSNFYEVVTVPVVLPLILTEANGIGLPFSFFTDPLIKRVCA